MRLKMNFRRLMYVTISIICVLSIISAVYNEFDLRFNRVSKPKSGTQNTKNQEDLKRDINSLFNNEVELNGYDVSKIKKSDDSKDIVYTAYKSDAKEDDKYELDIHIPVINIEGDVVSRFNEITQNIFANKTTEILQESENYTIYNVDYTGYINGDVLSVIIKSTLKEGSNAQRTIVETYNYNLLTKKETTIYDAIEQTGIEEHNATVKINGEIVKAIEEANKIQITGHEVYTRDINSEIYNIDNIETFFIGSNNKLYIIFAYGNNNFTSEMDIIEF